MQPLSTRNGTLSDMPTQTVLPFGVPQFFTGNMFPAMQVQQQGRGSGSRSGACASRHMAAEQRRRQRINERLEALRTLVPHSARANTAAFLTEVYNYISALHKQLDKLGGNFIDLNVAAVDNKDSKPHADKVEKKKRHRESKSDTESEVESEDNHILDGGADSPPCELKSLFPTVSAPSLFDSLDKDKTTREQTAAVVNGALNKKAGGNTVQKQQSQQTQPQPQSQSQKQQQPQRQQQLLQQRASAFAPLANPLPPQVLQNLQASMFFGAANQEKGPLESCDTEMTLGLGSVHSSPTSQQLSPTEIPPAQLAMLPAFHPSAVVAAAAAVADAAASLQQWNMTAAIAQAQINAHAQAHSQAQAHAQVLAQAQAQLLACGQGQSQQSISRKKRKTAGSETCAMRQNRALQGVNVVRPIALKPGR